MSVDLRNLIVRGPVSGRIFMVEKDPSSKPAPLTLRRLDRELREQAHVYRTRGEVLAMEVLHPRPNPKAHMELKNACRSLLKAWGTWANPAAEVEVTVPSMDPILERISELVEA